MTRRSLPPFIPMLCSALGLLLGLATAPERVEARVPMTWLRVRFEVEGLRTIDLQSPSVRTRYADRAVLVGKIEPTEASFALVWTEVDGETTSAQRRDLGLKGAQGEHELFEVAGIACARSTSEIVQGLRQIELRAFPNAAGHGFELAISSVAGAGRSAFERAAFEEHVASARFAWLRRGTFEDYPPEVIETMHAHLLGGDRTLETRLEQLLERLAKIKQGEAPAPEPAVDFAFAELLSRREHPLELITPIYDRVLAALARKSKSGASRTAQESLLAALSEEGSGRLYLRDRLPGKELGLLDSAIGCFGRALEAARGLRPEFRAGITYNLACAHALVPDVENALKRLEEAIGLDPSYRDLARQDPDFDRVRGEMRFQELVGKEQ